jgi:Zn-dependent alcohol dehydrogenase
VLVEMKAASLCHTDWASRDWGRPLVMGHEGAGVVTAVGAGVTKVRPGDAVVLNWAIPCGECRPCGSGLAPLCEWSKPGHVLEPSAAHAHAEGSLLKGQPVDRSFNIGTLSELTLVKEAAVTRLPSEVAIPWASAAVISCGVLTGWGSAVKVAALRPGSTVVVQGCGGVGLNVIQGARHAGATTIIGIDPVASQRDGAMQFGATHTLAPLAQDGDFSQLAAAVQEICGGRGADVAFECTSLPALTFAPLRLIRDGGMALQVSGINDSVMVNPQWFMWNKTYITPLYGNCVPDDDVPQLISLYEQGRLKLDELVTRTYGLRELSIAFEDMLAGRLRKGVILFQ